MILPIDINRRIAVYIRFPDRSNCTRNPVLRTRISRVLHNAQGDCPAFIIHSGRDRVFFEKSRKFIRCEGLVKIMDQFADNEFTRILENSIDFAVEV